MELVKLYIKFINIYIKSKIEYRAGLFFELMANFILLGVYFIGVYVIFYNFDNVHGWSKYEFIFMFTTNWISYSLSSYFLWKPMQDMGNMITTGEFDLYLIRPISPLTYLVFRQFQYTFLPRMILAAIFWIYSIHRVNIEWSIMKALYLICTLIMGFFIYSSIFVILGALSFWILRSNEVTSIIINNDYGIRTFADYPLVIYKKSIQMLLTYILPFGFTGYYTVAFLLEKRDEGIMSNCTPFIALIMTVLITWIAKVLWSKGIKRYSSTGN